MSEKTSTDGVGALSSNSNGNTGSEYSGVTGTATEGAETNIEVSLQQLRILHKNALTGTAMVVPTVLIFFIVLWTVTPHTLLIAWCTLMAAVLMYRSLVGYRFLQDEDNSAEPQVSIINLSRILNSGSYLLTARLAPAEATEPTIGDFEPNLLTQPALRADRVAVAHHEHPDHQFRTDRGTAHRAVVRLEGSPQPVQIENPVDLAQQVILRNNVFKIKLIEKTVLLTNRIAHHRRDPVLTTSAIQNHDMPNSSNDFFNTLSQLQTNSTARFPTSHVR